ncbi:hypothetical protein [Gloeothece verrucosa]|uniref:Uncharacterized protein n=1 Tax=Gloeothece verrucosa (strain PCC 7822) TaxID=497965 RepID=E0UNK6_GLOV7|nr:hypothetical protein [Gloeothece verrucosa]ADN18536.1 hypothetical protein Cyan7822_6892 [Gloeothece verrucosa PCC 7822]
MTTQLLENGRVAVTETFKAELPLMSAQFHWQDGKDCSDYDPDFSNHLMLCSAACDLIVGAGFKPARTKDASQEEINQFIEEVLNF